jgi:hypothetical protein
MAMFVVRRRHRLLYLVLAILAFSTWGLWLGHTGRATDYSDTVPVDADARGVTNAPAAAASAAISTVFASASAPAGAAVTSPAGSSSTLAGISTPTVFARRVASLLLSYDAGTDFAARTGSVMAVAALPPLGNPTELKSDLTRLMPDPSSAGDGVSVRFAVDRVSVSAWAATRIARLHLPDGSFAVDVTGRQIIDRPGTAAVTVTVTLGMTGACPPALAQCELDRVFPQTVRQELDR